MTEKINLGISSCLLGERVRYDGSHARDRYITDTLGAYFNWVPVCPEVEMGLPVPRESMRLVGRPESPRLIARKSGADHTDTMLKWASRRLKELERENLAGFIFKSKSPSSGIGGVKVYTEKGMPSHRGNGIFGGAFIKGFPSLPAIDDGRLNNPALRENFIERVFVFKRWQDLMKGGGSIGDLVRFHTSHKLLLLSHSNAHYTELGRLMANARRFDRGVLHEKYISALMEGLKLLATARKNTNVLTHIMGYFKKLLEPDEKKELLEVIDNYHRGLVPLIVPVTLMNHYVRKFDIEYLKGQHYLSPHPIELMLRNHV
jgi:uncharacterized protein YbgA (DUF1722 family)/uncharacterized protein YbbK (DUF523 family)